MSETSKQEISEIKNSFVQQANGDINIFGLGYKDVKDICHDVVRQELSIVTKEAVDTFRREISLFEEQFIDRLENLENPQVVGKLATPKLQFVLHDTIKEYAKNDDTNTKEELVDLLIDRLKVEEHTTKQHLIDECIKVIPNLSINQTYFLGALTLRKIKYQGICYLVNTYLEKCAFLYKYMDITSNLDIQYLILKNCCTDLGWGKQYNPILDGMRTNYDLLFRHSITKETYDSFMHDHPNMNNIGIHIVLWNNGGNKLLYSSKDFLMQKSQVKGLQNHISELEQLINLYTPFSDDEIKHFVISLHPDWQKALNCYDKEEVRHIDLTPLGTYIGRRIIKKLTNYDTLSLEAFYK